MRASSESTVCLRIRSSRVATMMRFSLVFLAMCTAGYTNACEVSCEHQCLVFMRATVVVDARFRNQEDGEWTELEVIETLRGPAQSSILLHNVPHVYRECGDTVLAPYPERRLTQDSRIIVGLVLDLHQHPDHDQPVDEPQAWSIVSGMVAIPPMCQDAVLVASDGVLTYPDTLDGHSCGYARPCVHGPYREGAFRAWLDDRRRYPPLPIGQRRWLRRRPPKMWGCAP